MKRFLSAIALASLVLGGCCMKTRSAGSASTQDQEAWSDYYWCGIFSGYGTAEMPDRAKALYTPVTANEYANMLCERVAIEDYATCMNRVLDHYQRSQHDRPPKGNSTSGPFAMEVAGEVYVGAYVSDPFSASFRVASGAKSCRGSYNALFGDTAPVFKVVCDNGKRGEARIVRDRSGRNGIGYVAMNDGTQGRILFGPNVASAAEQRF